MTSRRILVVDDDDDIREITRLALEVMGGWTVREADRGATAIEVVREDRPDVILLDVMMPEMDGPTTFLALEADPATRGVPVILLTAKVQAGLRQVWDDLPVRGVIGKPFNPMTLTSEIELLLRRPDEALFQGSADGQRSA